MPARHALRFEPAPRRLLLLALLALLGLLGACASPPPAVGHLPAEPLGGLERTPLARIVRDSTAPDERHSSGLRLLADGEQAFDARIALAQRAARSLDLQTYLLADDAAGRRLLRELRDAAARGVRVRVLLDDLHAAPSAALLAGLAAHPNVEVRLFNPLPVRTGTPLLRLALSAPHFEQLHRRMHNKLFIADGQVAIAGGRNVADEYFLRAHAANFVDMDLLLTGTALPPLTESFERYWNSAYAHPLHELLPPPADAAAARRHFEIAVGTSGRAAAPAPIDLFGQSPVGEQLARGRLALFFAPVQVLADTPDKVAAGRVAFDDSALGRALLRLRAACCEVAIVSPYFIPGERGMALLREARAAQVRVSVLTNSMAATDEPMVHRAYARYREAMLSLDVALHELNPALGRRAGGFGDFRSSQARLHAKLAIADRRWVLLGSMNMDARSALANTELGLLIDSPALATQLRLLLQQATEAGTYRLRRAASGIEWVARDGDAEQVRRYEPDADWTLRLTTALLAPWVGEELL